MNKGAENDVRSRAARSMTEHMPRTRNTRLDELTAYHEAGHAVIAHLVGIPVTGVDIEQYYDGDGASWIEREVPDSPDAAHALLLTMIAGYLAAAHRVELRNDDRTDSHLMAGGMRDAAMAVMLALDLGTEVMDAAHEVERLFETRQVWAQVEAVAGALIVHATLNRAEFKALVDAPGERMA
jgi:hypothetical protein